MLKSRHDIGKAVEVVNGLQTRALSTSGCGQQLAELLCVHVVGPNIVVQVSGTIFADKPNFSKLFVQHMHRIFQALEGQRKQAVADQLLNDADVLAVLPHA